MNYSVFFMNPEVVTSLPIKLEKPVEVVKKIELV